MFNPRIFLGTITTAGVLVVGAAVPAMAAKPAHHHRLKPVDVVRTVLKPVQDAAGSTTPFGGSPISAVANPLSGLLSGIPIIGSLLGTGPGIPAGGSNPVTGVLHGLTSGGGLSAVTSSVGGTIDSIAKAVPGANNITSLLPGGSVSGTLNGLTGGALNGLTNGALSGLTNAVPGIGSVTNALPKLNG